MGRLVGLYSVIAILSNVRQIPCQSNTQLGFRAPPTISAECSTTNMFIYVDTSEPFRGIVNARGHRDACFSIGDGSRRTILIIPLLATPSDAFYCGQQLDVATGEYKIYVDVHAHRVLEVENDKTFLISCNQNGVLGQGEVRLSLLQKGQELSRVVQGEEYTVQIAYTNATLANNQQLSVRNCIAFGRGNSTQALSDSRGCPIEGSGLSKFEPSNSPATVQATLKSMLRFQDSSQVHIQCDVLLCRAPCPPVLCVGDVGYNPNNAAVAQIQPRQSGSQQGLAGSTFTVLEPGMPNGAVAVPVNSAQCGYGEWVLALCITFGILFLIMLIVNIVLCSAVSLNLTKKEEKSMDLDPSGNVWGEYATVKNGAWSTSSAASSVAGQGGLPNGAYSHYAERPLPPYQTTSLAPNGGAAVLYDDAVDIHDARSYAETTGRLHRNDVYDQTRDRFAGSNSQAHRNGAY
ncbi:hypothetical protein RvY_12061 [Ramazzottius varieornatus]|uniref:ZP domain-containing protein n=1 Tax=Ramazzottius varieornatus TaxID=947166 RepID=A0A1D1VK88_RAMVA|nr:hypothetical protein RvY_12061 [Ramazzottius varieornatus]